MQYIPGNATGETFFILMNQYADGAAADKDWSTQLNFNMNTNKVGSVNLVRDQWKEVRVEVDLVGNTRREYYDNNLIATDIWYGPNGAAKIAAIDLYGNNASPVYYDDLRMAPVPEPGTIVFLLGSLVTLPWLRRRPSPDDSIAARSIWPSDSRGESRPAFAPAFFVSSPGRGVWEGEAPAEPRWGRIPRRSSRSAPQERRPPETNPG